MKIRIFCASAALLLAFASPAQAAALAQTEPPAATSEAAPVAADTSTQAENSETTSFYPVDVQVSSDGLTCKKIYDVPKNTSPDQIPQDDFDRGDMHYTFQDMLRIEMPDIDRKMHSETVTVSSTSDNSNDVMALLPKSKAVTTEDGYSGTAYLDVSSISTKVAGTESVSEPLTATREYPNLPEMDMTDIPKTIEENGHTLTFDDIEWTEDAETTGNLGTMATTYTAVVTYTGTATSSRTTGYTVTATYAGEVSHRNNDCMRYIVVYSGEPIVIEPVTELLPPDLSDLLPEPEAQPEINNEAVPLSWALCVVFGVLMILFALRPPACRRMMKQMQAMAAQAGGKVQQTIKETEMKIREMQKQKQAEDEKLREAQHIFGPLEKIKAAIRSRRQRKAQERARLLAAPADDGGDGDLDSWAGTEQDGIDGELDAQSADDAVPDDTQDGAVQYNGADDDEYPGLGG